MRKIRFKGQLYDQSNIYFYIEHLLSGELLSHKSFDRQIKDSISFLEDDGLAPNKDYLIDLHILNNKLTLSSFLGDSCRYMHNNNCYRRVTISLDEDGDMDILKSSGIFLNISDYNVEFGQSINEGSIVCHVEHTRSHYKPNGIETTKANYIDDFPLDTSLDDKQELQNCTLFHTPLEWKDTFIPEVINTGVNTRRNVLYRDPNQMGIIHMHESIENDNCEYDEIYSSCLDVPNGSICRDDLIAENIDGNLVLSSKIKRDYPDKSFEEICSILNSSYTDNSDYIKSDDQSEITSLGNITVLR